MQTIRRIYFYLIAAISLIGISWSIIGLLRLILSEGIGQGQIIGLASWLAVIIVGLPIFLFHWLYAQRMAAKHPAERHSLVRQIFLYGVMAAGVTPIISNIYRLVDNLLLTLMGGTRLDYYPYNMTTGEHLAALVIWAIVWTYLWQQINTDRRLRQTAPAAKNQPAETDSIAEILMKTDPEGVRRVYRLVFSLTGLVMVTWGMVGLLQLLMELPGSVPWRTPVANLSAKLLVGGAIWVLCWLMLQRTFLSGDPAEERSVLRKLYLYLAVFVFSVMAVGSGTALLKRLIELALGDSLPAEPLLSQFSTSIPLMIVGGIFWAYHWQTLKQDASLAPEIPRQAGVRRIYAYLVAAVGLAVLLTGLGGLLSIVVDLLTTPAEVGLAYYRENIALTIAMIVVGTPVWLLPWQAMQALALHPATIADETDVDGESERRSIVRKIYLYLYVFLAAVAVFGSAGWFIFHILTAILGADLPNDFITQVLDALVIALLAVGVWVYHWWAIQHDGNLQKQDQAQRLRAISVAVLDGGDGQLGKLIIQHLQQTLPGLQPQAIGLTPQAVEAMGGLPLNAAPDPLSTAQFIIGSWQTLTSPEAAAVNNSPARKLAIPLTAPGWIWAGVEQRPLDYYAQQAARGIQQALEGEAITPARETDITAVLAIIGGILLFLLVIGSLLGTVLSML